MLPKFKPNDRVLTFNWSKISPKDVVVFKNSVKLLIKRVEKIQNLIFLVAGDNKAANSLVRRVKKAQIVGKVVAKY